MNKLNYWNSAGRFDLVAFRAFRLVGKIEKFESFLLENFSTKRATNCPCKTKNLERTIQILDIFDLPFHLLTSRC